MSLKAYRLNEFEAWAGETLEDAISVAMKECGISREDAFDDEYGEEISGDMVITNDDGVTYTVASILTQMESDGDKGVVCWFGDS